MRSELNYFVATLYMCLKVNRPTILLEMKFEARKLKDVINKKDQIIPDQVPK